jgi:hypothetical protein
MMTQVADCVCTAIGVDRSSEPLESADSVCNYELQTQSALLGDLMNARSTAARKILRARSAATRLTASLRRGRSLTTHVLAAGIAPATAPGVVNGLRTVAKRLGVTPVKTSRTHRTIAGTGRMRRVGHYTAAQVQLLLTAYRPRKAEYIAAAHQLAA